MAFPRLGLDLLPPPGICTLTGQHLETSRKRGSSLAVHWVKVVVSFELCGHHLVCARRLVMEVQRRVPVVGHVWLHAMGIAFRCLRCSEIKRWGERTGAENIVDVVTGVLAR